MKVLVIGSGGREHALVWKLRQSAAVDKVFCAPGNAGIAADAECVAIGVEEADKLADFVRREGIGLVVVGPEAPLCAGVADVLRGCGAAVFGPGKAAAQLEGSKEFAKNFMLKYGIPTARGESFTAEAPALEYIASEFARGVSGIVVKADGLAAGKGVLVAEDRASAEEFTKECFRGAFGSAGAKVVIEEMLTGEETSVLALTDGKTIIRLASSQEHNRVFDGDRGPNTGGMGAYSPAPVVTPEVEKRIDEEILKPFLRGLAAEKLDYRGVLFAGLMIENGMPKVLEFNVRFGDPEVQPVMRRLEGDLCEILLRTARGELAGTRIEWSGEPCVSVVMASGGYPGKYAKGFPISGLDDAAAEGAVVFHAGTAFKDGRIVNSGGWVLGVSARGRNIRDAIANAYRAVDKISFEGGFCRRDIGAKALKHEGK
ncbi:MAG: phosphoribosylamine--glycine ligase [Lentisphaeria bacterium]|nr:phosphoribosylamine--glycine ligase [Lentisphaeria bacterium]